MSFTVKLRRRTRPTADLLGGDRDQVLPACTLDVQVEVSIRKPPAIFGRVLFVAHNQELFAVCRRAEAGLREGAAQWDVIEDDRVDLIEEELVPAGHDCGRREGSLELVEGENLDRDGF